MGKRKSKDLDRELRRLRRKIDKIANQKKTSNELTHGGSPKRPRVNKSPETLTPERIVISPEPTEQPVFEEPIKTPEQDIDNEILSAMGAVEEEAANGPPVHLEIAQRWTPILTKGLKTEEKLTLTKQYHTFINIPNMVPPKLNPELAAAVTEPVKKRDTIIEHRQRKLATALAAIGSGLQIFLTKGNKVDGIKHFNDAARIMCDIFHDETGSRRMLIQSVINKDMKASLQDEPNEYLFGSTLSERIKLTKAVQKSAQELTNKNMTTKPNNNNNKANTATNRTLNWRAPPQQSYRQGKQNYSTNKQSSGGVMKKGTRQEYKRGRPQHHHRSHAKK